MQEQIEKAKAEIEPLMGKLTVDHAAFIEQWTKENLTPGKSIIGLAVLASGIGASAGIFCSSMAKTMDVHPRTLKEMIVVQMEKQIGLTSC